MSTYHLYSDGNYFPRAKKSGFGGYILDPQGNVIVEYSEQIKQTAYIHNFELLGIIRGLSIAQDKKIDNIVSHCDDKNTAALLKEIFEDNVFKVSPSRKPELYEKIIELSKSFKKITFEYIPRSQNKYADSLSRRYAVMMEDNFLKHYDNELNQAETKFLEQGKLPKRMFFSHPKMVRNPNKNNPFLVASHRNKKVRKLSRLQEEKNYNFLFIEHFMQDDNLVFRSFIYDNEKKLKNTHESIFSNDKHIISNFSNFFSDSLSTLSHKNVWAFSNISLINSFLEQREKIPNEHSDSFHKIFDSFNKFDSIFFHHFPFSHEFSPEISSKEIKKEKLKETYDSLETLMDNLSNGVLGKEQNKNFGNLIRHHFRIYQKQLKRELDETEKVEIINKTTDELNKLGFKNIRSFRAI